MTKTEAEQRTIAAQQIASALAAAMRDLQRDGVHKALGLTWREYVETYFDVSLDWYYRERRAAEAAKKVANCNVPTDGMARDTITTLGELPAAQIPVVYTIAKQTSTNGSITAANVREAAARIGEYAAQTSVNGYPASEIIAAGIIQEQRDRANAHSNRVYITDTVQARMIINADNTVTLLAETGLKSQPPIGAILHGTFWYEIEVAPDV